MIRTLPYCAFLYRDSVSLPESGVNDSPVREITQGKLGLLWSEVAWPLAESSLRQSAVDFHKVISHMFSQGAVVPFRLLSVFENRQAMVDFITMHHANFVADLERLHNLVQMECVLYPAPDRNARVSGKDYLEKRAGVLHRAEHCVEQITAALKPVSRGIRVRESNKGSRIFILVERGNEPRFREIAHEIPVPEQLSRRTSGPWPPSEFLSEEVKMPHTTR